MKRVICGMLAAAMLLGLGGCAAGGRASKASKQADTPVLSSDSEKSDDTGSTEGSGDLTVPDLKIDLEPYDPSMAESDSSSASSASSHRAMIEAPELKGTKITPLRDVYVSGSPASSFLSERVKKLSDYGFTIDADIENTKVAPGEISGTITGTYGGAKVILRAINTHENEVSLGECRVCYFYTDDTAGSVEMDSQGNRCGSTFDDCLYSDTYINDGDLLVYKTYEFIFGADYIARNDPRGKEILGSDGECALVISFENGKASSFAYVLLNYISHGLSDNISFRDLLTLDDSQLIRAAKVKDTILSRLEAAFAKANIRVGIDEQSGQIVMDNDVLFALDSYELSDEGKAYLDSFIGTYVSVLTDDEFKTKVDSINFEGHTDSSGDYSYNLELSQKRAEAVMNYCLTSGNSGLTAAQKDTLRSMATATGFASSDLVYTSSGKEDADASRRVAVKFYVKADV